MSNEIVLNIQHELGNYFEKTFPLFQLFTFLLHFPKRFFKTNFTRWPWLMLLSG